MIDEKIYCVETLRSGQPRAYADTEMEYLITIKSTAYGKDGLHPWTLHGDLEKRIREEETLRAQGKMIGGHSPEQLRAQQREWAVNLVKALCHKFRETSDQDGRTGMEAHFYPTLKSLAVNPSDGTIRAFIVEPYTD